MELDRVPEVKLPRAESKSKELELDPFDAKASEFFKAFGPSMDKNAVRRAKYQVSKYEQGNDGAGSKQLRPYITGYDILQAVRPPYSMESLAQLYEKSPWNYAAVNAKVANVIGLGFRFDPSPSMQAKLDSITDSKKLDKARKRLDTARRQLEQWVASLNNTDLFIQVLTKAYIDYQATGNGYIEIGRVSVGPNKGQIGYVGHIPSSTMRVRKDHDGFVQIVSGSMNSQHGIMKFFRNYGDQSTVDPLGIDDSPNEIIHLKSYTPTNTFYGLPDIVPAMNAVAGSEFASRFNLDYFEHRAAPRYMIIAKGANLSETSQAHILEFLQSGLKGKSHRSIYIPLPVDREGTKSSIEFKPVEVGIQDSSFENYRKSNRDEILAVHRTPLSKLGIESSGNSAGNLDIDKAFKEVVCRPEQDVIEQKINKIIAEKTDIFVMQLNELTLTDSLSQSQIDERYLRLKTITPNEARKNIGLGPMHEGDEVVDLKPQQAADQRATALKTRERDSRRQLNGPDINGENRNPKGAGTQSE